MVSTSQPAVSDRGFVGTADGSTTVVSVASPTDLVRWGPIWAGLFTALSTLALLGVLGLAVGFSSYDAGDSARSFGIGAGWWAAISALIAFFVGGMVSSRVAATTDGTSPGRNNGVFQGAMVWVVAVPLLVYLVSGMVGSAARATGSVANTAAQTGTALANTPQGQQAAEQAPPIQSQIQNAGEEVRQAATPQNVEQASRGAAKGAWGMLLSMVLGLAAAAVGGLVGAGNLAATRRRDTAIA